MYAAIDLKRGRERGEGCAAEHTLPHCLFHCGNDLSRSEEYQGKRCSRRVKFLCAHPYMSCRSTPFWLFARSNNLSVTQSSSCLMPLSLSGYLLEHSNHYPYINVTISTFFFLPLISSSCKSCFCGDTPLFFFFLLRELRLLSESEIRSFNTLISVFFSRLYVWRKPTVDFIFFCFFAFTVYFKYSCFFFFSSFIVFAF